MAALNGIAGEAALRPSDVWNIDNGYGGRHGGRRIPQRCWQLRIGGKKFFGTEHFPFAFRLPDSLSERQADRSRDATDQTQTFAQAFGAVDV